MLIITNRWYKPSSRGGSRYWRGERHSDCREKGDIFFFSDVVAYGENQLKSTQVVRINEVSLANKDARYNINKKISTILYTSAHSYKSKSGKHHF